jgi:DNA-binding transcriptional MerR regulator
MKTFTTRDLADEFGLTLRTLRFYEQKGLVTPARTKRNDRLYSEQDRARVRGIVTATQMGFSLREVEQLVAEDGNLKLSPAQVSTQMRYLEERRAEIERAMAVLSALLDQRAAA